MRKLIVTGIVAGALFAGLPVQASPYDQVLADDFALDGKVAELLELVGKCCKREWVVNDPTMAVGAYSVRQQPNGLLVTLGTGGVQSVDVNAVVERVVTNGMDEYQLTLATGQVGKDIKVDIDRDGDVDVIWDRVKK